jgi:adenylate cyclase
MDAWHCGACGGENPDGMRFCGHCGQAATVAPAPQAPPAHPSPPSPVDERRLVTALFADVSGFTTLAERLDAEELHDAIAPLIRALAAIAEGYGGTIAKYAGDALLVFFGAPVAREDDAARALTVALEMHAGLPRLLADLPADAHGLQLHIGVNTGRVIAGRYGGEVTSDYSILGDAVNLAQRLESVAPPGETYVGELTYDLTCSVFGYEDVGSLTLKGKQVPVRGWRLIGHEQRTDEGDTPLIGRVGELGVARRALEGLETDGGGVLAITGEPGIGKTHLLAAARHHAQRRGLRWLETRCLSYGEALPYWPYRELLRQLLGLGAGEDTRAVEDAIRNGFRQRGDEQVAVLAELLGSSAGASDGSERFRDAIVAAVSASLGDLAADGPFVLALEDVQWADGPSRELTAAVGTLTAAQPILLVVTARAAAPAVADLRAAASRVWELPLLPLASADGYALLVELLGANPPQELVDFVTERATGNPLFVHELVRVLQDVGTLYERDGYWHLRPGWDPDQVPPTIERLLAGRIDLLPQAHADVLQTAAVIGRRVPLALLRGVLPDVPELNTVVDALVLGGFFDRTIPGDDGVVAFHHALIQDVAYARLLRRRRRELHERVAGAGEALYGAGEEIIELVARHRYLGHRGPKALDALVRAGERARRLYATNEALLHFTRAVEVARTDEVLRARIPDVLLRVAQAHEVRGEYDEAFVAYREARQLRGDVEAWRGMASTLRRSGQYAEALDIVAEALAELATDGADPALAPLWLERGWTLSIVGHATDSVEALRTGLALCAGTDIAVEGYLLAQLARAEALTEAFDDAVAHATRARDLFARLDDARGLASATRVLGTVLCDADAAEDAADVLREALALASGTGTVEELAGVLLNLGVAEKKLGNLDEATSCYRGAVEQFERIGHGSGRAVGYCNLAAALLEAGQPDEALLWCEKSIAQSEDIGHDLMLADAVETKAQIRLRQGLPHEAAALAADAAARYAALEMETDVANAQALREEAEAQAAGRERAG